jgi:DNA (cytosine-5)-methyltransferase 1
VSGPILYDIYCGAGGAARGYMDAGFEVWGVDSAPQTHYCGDRFIQMDALDFIGTVVAGDYPMPDAWHASPPCQAYSRMLCATGATTKPKLIGPTRDALKSTGRPYIIENVELAKSEMTDWVLLCGTGFGLRVRRHRLFETSPVLPILVPPCHCKNGVRDGALIGHRLTGPKPPGRKVPPVFTERELREAIGVEWMPMAAMREAIPPAYTRFLGEHLLSSLSPATPSPDGREVGS